MKRVVPVIFSMLACSGAHAMLVSHPDPPAAMPEPSTLATLGLYLAGVVVLFYLKRRQSKQAKPKAKA
jgi:hypothetical protein